MARNMAARLAGFLYLAQLPTAGFAFGFIEFMPHGDAASSLAWLTANRQMLAWTVLLGAAGFTGYLLIVALLRKLLAPTGTLAAELMTVFVVASVPLSLAALAQRMDLIGLIDTAPATLSPEAMLLLQGQHNLFAISAIFWGLWLLPLGWLVWRSGLAPRLLGAGLIFGGCTYLWAFAAPLLDAHYASSALGRWTGLLAFPTMAAELGFGLWILIFGARGLKAGKEAD